MIMTDHNDSNTVSQSNKNEFFYYREIMLGPINQGVDFWFYSCLLVSQEG